MPKRVLVIDDEDHIRRMMRLTLETAGYDVGEAGDGLKGIETFGDGSGWDAVLLDQKMPGIDGLETLRRIKERASNARVIMVTAFASIELAVDAMKLGATDFVRKPMTPEIVRNAVEAALAKPAPATAPEGSASPFQAEPRRPSRPSIQTVTMNGFQIMRPSDIGDDTPDEPGERRFVVKNPNGWQREVVVGVPDEVVDQVARLTRHRLPPESSFWSSHAERLLASYLWNAGKIPSERLKLEELGPEELATAAQWEG